MTQRRLVAAGIAVVVTGVLLSGSGVGSSAASVRGARETPARAARAQDGAPGFGYSVALSADGTTALVGAPGVEDRKGAAYVFHVSGAGSWSSIDTPTATLKSGQAFARYFGSDIALSADGTTAFVAASTNDGARGAVYVFHVSAEDAWSSSSTPAAILTVDSLGELGPLAVSSDGTTLVTSGSSDQHGGTAYIFHASSEDAWATTSTPTAELGSACCAAVAISGDGTTVLLSDSADYQVGGAGLVFHVAAEDAWTSSTTPTAVLTDADAETGMGSSDSLGHYIALSGDGTVAFLGAPTWNSKPSYVDVFHASGEAAWVSTSTPTATLTKAGAAREDDLGSTMSASSDGTTVFLSASNAQGGRFVCVYRVSDAGAWASTSAPTATLTNSSGHAGDGFGGDRFTLSADGVTALFGASGARFGTGAANLFHVSDASSWGSSSTPTAILTVSALNRCVVPRLKGLRVLAAKSRLRARSCRLGRVTRVVHARGRSGRVVSQSARPGARLAVGAKIAVKVKK